MIAHLAFRLFDTNYDGYIDKKEFKWMTTSAKISNRTIDIVFSVISPLFETKTDPCIERCDTDGDGKLDYQEFKSMIFRSKARKEETISEEEKDFKRKTKTIKKDVSRKGKKGKGSK